MKKMHTITYTINKYNYRQKKLKLIKSEKVIYIYVFDLVDLPLIY